MSAARLKGQRSPRKLAALGERLAQAQRVSVFLEGWLGGAQSFEPPSVEEIAAGVATTAEDVRLSLRVLGFAFEPDACSWLGDPEAWDPPKRVN